MSEDGEDSGNIIQFPFGNKSETESSSSVDQEHEFPDEIRMTKDSVVRLVKTLSTIHLATTYKASKNETCKVHIKAGNFPCKINCACYVNVCAAMGLHAFLGGEAQEEAIKLVDAEHDLMRTIHDVLVDEDDS